MADTQTFDPVAAGFRVADEPIKRRPRTPSSRAVPKPKYADAVWYSFQNSHPLEVTVPVKMAEDTVRQLKRAARYLERTHPGNEVRVQISIEPMLGENNEPVKPPKSVVKFLGHAPWLLGRRIAKEAAEQAQEAAKPAAKGGQHRRRTVAATRATARKASLRGALVRAVITWPRPPCPEWQDVGAVVFLARLAPVRDTSFSHHCLTITRAVRFSHPSGFHRQSAG